LGGLLSSVLLAKEGKKVLLLEQHRIPGGYCTSYRRKGFTFNVPSVLTSISGGEIHTALDSLGFFDEVELVKIEDFAKFIYPDFELVMPANDLEGCRENLKAAFPSEKTAIERIFSEMSKYQNDPLSSSGKRRSGRELIAFIIAIAKLIMGSKKSFYDYMKEFTGNERLIEILSALWVYTGLPSKSTPSMFHLMLTGECYGKPSFVPRDGFQAISDFLAKKLLEYGGEIKYRTKVNNILMNNNKASGVITSDGEDHHADSIISNADTKKTFFELVGRQNLSKKIISMIDAHRTSASGISLQIGTNLDLSGLDLKYGNIFYNESWENSNSYFERAIANKVDIEKDNIPVSLQVTSLLTDRLAPEGMNTIHVLLFPVSHDYCNNFGVEYGERGEDYKRMKDRITDILISKAEKIIPGLSGSIIVKELSTPYTFERYTGATNGAWYDGVFSINQKMKRPSGNTPIKGLYVTGTKAFGGSGLPSALNGGITTVKTILSK